MSQTRRRLCLIEDDEIMGESLADRFELEGLAFDWHRTGNEALQALREQDYALAISDIRLPDIGGDMLYTRLRDEGLALPPFIFITGHGDIDTAVRLLKQGAQDYVTKPFDLDALIDKIRDIAAPADEDTDGELGSSPAMREISALLPRLATSNASVLITGESGVGKERVAQALHRLGGDNRPFVAVNCGALTESLLEAEFFGYEKGAFTGAVRSRKGLFEQANGGTLFLDEIGDMPLAMQVKLLRALQERCITRVGGEQLIPVSLRLLCATHRDLKEMVGTGDFREDLYYRIRVMELRVPPLRERREDILWLGKRLLEGLVDRREMAPCLSPVAARALQDYHWPGNVRELKNTIERALLLSNGRCISLDDLFERPAPSLIETQDAASSLRDYLAECERDFIVRALERSGWQIQTCADSLGISRKNLWEKMKKLDIEREGGEPPSL